jgi:hypothetical protein
MVSHLVRMLAAYTGSRQTNSIRSSSWEIGWANWGEGGIALRELIHNGIKVSIATSLQGFEKKVRYISKWVPERRIGFATQIDSEGICSLSQPTTPWDPTKRREA